MAAMMYAGDNDDHLPPASAWMDRVAPYLGKQSDALLRCPDIAGEAGYGYAMHRRFSGKSIDKIAAPAKQILFFEAEDLSRNASADSVQLAARHRGSGDPRGNVAFVDGSARSLAAAEAAAIR